MIPCHPPQRQQNFDFYMSCGEENCRKTSCVSLCPKNKGSNCRRQHLLRKRCCWRWSSSTTRRMMISLLLCCCCCYISCSALQLNNHFYCWHSSIFRQCYALGGIAAIVEAATTITAFGQIHVRRSMGFLSLPNADIIVGWHNRISRSKPLNCLDKRYRWPSSSSSPWMLFSQNAGEIMMNENDDEHHNNVNHKYMEDNNTSNVQSNENHDHFGVSSNSNVYNLGLGKNLPLPLRDDDPNDDDPDVDRIKKNQNHHHVDGSSHEIFSTEAITPTSFSTLLDGGREAVSSVVQDVSRNWIVPEPVQKPNAFDSKNLHSRGNNNNDRREKPWSYLTSSSSSVVSSSSSPPPPGRRIRKMVARDNASQLLRGALWHEHHFERDQQSQQPLSSLMTMIQPQDAVADISSSSSTVLNFVPTGNHDTSPPKIPDVMSPVDSTNPTTVIASSSSSSVEVATPLYSETPKNAIASLSAPAFTATMATTAGGGGGGGGGSTWMGQLGCPPEPTIRYPDIDLSVPRSVFNDVIDPSQPPQALVDVIWENMRFEAYQEAQREPLLVSFLYSTILNHPSLESALAFCLANRLSAPGSLISTQLQSLILQALQESSDFRRQLRADLLAVRDRDPACMSLPQVFLYFKGFQALQAHRVAHFWWTQQMTTSLTIPTPEEPKLSHRRQVLAQYLQSQVSQTFQIDIHPNATLGSGIMLDHGTGIVIGETARVGDNCSILHHVTLGGSGKKGVDRHPKVGNGVLLGAGATVLGNVQIGDGCQVGAGTLVITDLPPHSVAVGVPAKIIGQFVDVTEQPSIGMNQMLMGIDNVPFITEGI